MDQQTKEIIWGQLGAAIDTLGNAIDACPDQLWGDQTRFHQYWYMVSHTLFWLDYYLEEDFDNFKPPEPFGLEELNPEGELPPRVYTKDELFTYLAHGRKKAYDTIMAMTAERARRIVKFRKADITHGELMLYIMRHVQHHAAQLHLILRQETDSAPRWVFRAG